MWLHYGRWLVASLTFQLAADILATSIASSRDELVRLATVAQADHPILWRLDG